MVVTCDFNGDVDREIIKEVALLGVCHGEAYQYATGSNVPCIKTDWLFVYGKEPGEWKLLHLRCLLVSLIFQ